MEKRCSKCGESKPLTEFYKDRGIKDGLYWCCEKCIKAYYEAHKEEFRAYRQKIKQIVLGHYGTKCKMCGSTDIANPCIDHVNENGKEHRQSLQSLNSHIVGHSFYLWLIKHNFPEGYQPLCRRCNYRKTIMIKKQGIEPTYLFKRAYSLSL